MHDEKAVRIDFLAAFILLLVSKTQSSLFDHPYPAADCGAI